MPKYNFGHLFVWDRSIVSRSLSVSVPSARYQKARGDIRGGSGRNNWWRLSAPHFMFGFTFPPGCFLFLRIHLRTFFLPTINRASAVNPKFDTHPLSPVVSSQCLTKFSGGRYFEKSAPSFPSFRSGWHRFLRSNS